MNAGQRKRIVRGLTAYQRDVLLGVARSNRTEEITTGADVQAKVEQLRQKPTRNGRFYPQLSELEEKDLVTKSDHPDDGRSFTLELTEKGEAVLTELVCRTADSIGASIPECALPADGTRKIETNTAADESPSPDQPSHPSVH